MTIRDLLLALCVLSASAATWAGNPAAGKRFFRQQCAVCHSAATGDEGGAQGPNLQGVLGRRAASTAGFSYTAALKSSGITWDTETLNHFLSSPTTVAPGSAMVVAVPQSTDRDNLIAYFQGLADGTFTDTSPPQQFRPPPYTAPPAVQKDSADWRKDAPGRAHRIQLAKLPLPTSAPTATNFPRLIDKPTQAQLAVPRGFKVAVFASNLQAPRAMRLAPNGDIFLTETQNGRVKVLRPSADGARAASVDVFAQGLNLPFGMAFYPSGIDPQWLYVAETNRVVRYAYRVGDQHASSIPEVVVAQLSPSAGGGHFTRDLVFSPDGKRMFVSVGSATNVADGMSKKSAADIIAWESEHGLGTAWDGETNRADVLVFDVGSDAPGKVFASGIRNCVGLTVQPATGDLWCTTNERDRLGDDLVPDYSTRVRQGSFYGWPWYYTGNHEDPRLQGDRPDLAGKVSVPDVPYQAHSAALNMVFYTAKSGSAAFPKQYVGDAFSAFHGSWNRTFRTGHKLVRVRMNNNVPTGEYDDFLVGFIADDGDAWGRPVGLVVAADGSLLMSDDGANLIYRISYGTGTR